MVKVPLTRERQRFRLVGLPERLQRRDDVVALWGLLSRVLCELDAVRTAREPRAGERSGHRAVAAETLEDEQTRIDGRRSGWRE